METNLEKNWKKNLHPTKFPNIFLGEKGKLYVPTNLKEKLFDEEIVQFNNRYFRHFDSRRSKLAAAISKEISQIGLKKGDSILYLGASHGYTASFLSDIIEDGFIFAVDFAPRVVRDLVFLCEKKKNIAPILADANQPETYGYRIRMVDYLYQDVAQRNQAEIFIKNLQFLKRGGFGFIAIKSRSIDITKRPKEIYSDVRKQLEKEVIVVDYRVLDPFEKDHCVFVVKKDKR